MAATNALRRAISKSFYSSVRDRLSEDIYYAMTSFPMFPNSDTFLDSDGITVREEFELAKNALTMHRILPGGVSRVIPRVQWAENTIFEGWSIAATNYFVLVREFVSGVVQLNVYKCLYSPGTVSTTPPTGAPVSPFSTIDGYWWQFMYTIDNSSAIRFLTSEFMPVSERITDQEAENLSTGVSRYRQLIVQRNASRGGVYNLTIGQTFLDSTRFRELADGGSISIDGFSPLGDSDQSIIAQTFQGRIEKIDSDSAKFVLTQPGIGYGQDMYIVERNGTLPILGLRPAVAPGRGHGTDAAEEFLTTDLMLVVRNIPSGDFLPLAVNSFSTISLVLNPIDATTGGIGERDFYIACKSFDIVDGSANPFQPGDTVANERDLQPLATVVATDEQRVYYLTEDSDIEYVPFTSVYNEDSESYYYGRLSGGSVHLPVEIESLNSRQVVFNSHQTIVSDIQNVEINRSEDQIESMNFIFRF